MTNRLLPIYREFDVNMGTIVQAARAQGYAIPCKEGCDACCYDVAYTTEVELALVVERIRRMSPHRQKKSRTPLRSGSVGSGRPGSIRTPSRSST